MPGTFSGGGGGGESENFWVIYWEGVESEIKKILGAGGSYILLGIWESEFSFHKNKCLSFWRAASPRPPITLKFSVSIFRLRKNLVSVS